MTKMSNLALMISILTPNSIERKIRAFRDLQLRKYKIEPLPPEIYDQELKKHSISFCTNCMNRLFHLKQTVEANIKSNAGYEDVEFVLVNYNSQDGMHEWVKKHLMKYIEKGILNYYYTEDPEYFHMSKAKNLAHKLAKNEIVCNLDGDNFTGKDFAFYINYLLNQYGLDNIFHFKKEPYWGCEGRIVLSKDHFNRLGGYDESFQPAGYEDRDFIFRGESLGLEYRKIEVENFLRYFSNSWKEKSTGLAAKKVDYYDLLQENLERSNRNLDSGKFVANTENGWGKATVYKNFQPDPIQIS